MRNLKRERVARNCVWVSRWIKYDLERLGSFVENREMEEAWSTSTVMACGYREIGYSIGEIASC